MTETALQSGDQITTFEQIDELPIGSTICETGRPHVAWQKEADGLWHGIEDRAGNGPHDSEAFSMNGFNSVLERCGTPPPPPPQDTLLRFQWKFYDNALAGAHENGVSMDATLKGLRLLGLNHDWEMGPEVKFHILNDRIDWPNGTVIRNAGRGADDPKAATYSLFHRKRGTWQSLLGRSGLARDAVVIEYPGKDEPPAWWTEAATEQSVTDVANYKARCWRIGGQIKAEQSWCGTFEHVIARVGVTARSVREAQDGSAFGVGDRISQTNAAQLREGSLLLYRHDGWLNHWAIYRRDNSADNLTRTIRIAGHRNENGPALGHYQSAMTVLSIPVEGTSEWTVDQPQVQQMLDLLPVGTVFDYSGARYIKTRDGRMTDYRTGSTGIPDRGIHNSYAFSGAPMIVHHFEEQA